jgi:hypothetical protein
MNHTKVPLVLFIKIYSLISVHPDFCWGHEIVISLTYSMKNIRYRGEGRWVPWFTRGGIRCLGGVSIPCRPVTSAVNPLS